MPTITIPLSVVSILAAKPSTAFGQPAQVQVGSGARLLLAASVAQVPSNAIVSEAHLTFRQASAWGRSATVSAFVNTATWNAGTTYATQPANSSTVAGSQTQTAAAGATWTIGVTAAVQSWVSRASTNYGFKVLADAGTYGVFAGAAASSGRPTLTITYSTVALPPTNLRPQGAAVSVAKPTLTADTGGSVSAIQVQVDPAANGTSPGFDSGEVVSAAGVLDLSATSYAGLADGASTQWRMRIKNALGWSDWSAWASFSRAAWKALSVTSPGATVEDPSPTATATYAGTATAWRVQFLNAAGVLVSDSQWRPGATIAFAATAAVGASGTARVMIRDDVARTATPGDPDFLTADKAFTVSPSGTPAAPTSVQVLRPLAASPLVQVWVVCDAIPDELAVYRDGALVLRVAGASVFSGSGPYVAAVSDLTAPMNLPAVYSVRAVVNGAFSSEAAAASITPTCDGIWLLDPNTQTGVAVWTAEGQEQAQPELAALSRPIGGSNAVVRRRLGRGPREGAISGTLIDAVGVEGWEDLLATWLDPDAGYDAGHVFRLVLGNLNLPVIIGDTVLSERPDNMPGQRVVDVGFNWWTAA